MDKLLIVTGPTGVGKTKLGVALAREFGGEIISADSRQVYKYMDIGTGKDLAEYGEIPVWGIDLVLPNEEFSVAQWRKYAEAKIKEIWKRGKLPIVVGGTGLYIKALLEPFETINIPPDRELREKNYPVGELQRRLREEDPQRWERMNESDRENPRRLIRAVEVFSRRGLLETKDTLFKASPYNALIIGLTATREELRRRIEKRVDQRVAAGMEEEKKRLAAMGYFPDAIGYGEKTAEEWKTHERQYAKRQMTYLTKLPGVKWYIIKDGPKANTFPLGETTGEVRRFLGGRGKGDRGFRNRR